MATEVGPINISLTASGISEVLNAFKSIEERAVSLERKLNTISQAGARQRVKTSKDEANQKAKSGDQEKQAHEKAEQDKTKAAEKWSKQRERIIHNSAMMAGRLAKQQADQEIREAERSANARAAYSKQLAGRIVNDFRSTLGHVTRVFGAITALGGGLSVASAFNREMNVSRQATSLAIASDVQGKPEQRVSAAQATERARALSKEFNVDTDEVLETMHSIVAKTGKGKQAMDLTGQVTRIAKAEGVDPKQLGEAIGIVMAQNPKLSNEEIVNYMKQLVEQGKAGSVELTDMAKILPVATATSSLYAGDQGDNQAKLSSLLQYAIKTTGSPEHAATAVKDLANDFTKHSKQFAAKGINVFDPQGKLRDPLVLLKETLEKTGGTAKGIKGLFGLQSAPVIQSLNSDFQAAKDKGMNNKQAAQQVMGGMEEMVTKRLTEAKLEEHLAEVRKSDAEKVSKAMRDLETALALNLVPKLIPVIERLGELSPQLGEFSKQLAPLLEGLVSFVSWASKHPWLTVFLGVGASLTKAIAAEVLASGLRNVLANAVKGAPGSRAPGIPIATGGTPKAGISPIAMLGLVSMLSQADPLLEEGKVNAASLAEKVKSGEVPVKEAQRTVMEAQKRFDDSNFYSRSGNKQLKADQALVESEELKIAIQDAENTAATKENTKALDELKKALESKTGSDRNNNDSEPVQPGPFKPLRRDASGNLHFGQ